MTKIFKTAFIIGIVFFIPLYANVYTDAEIARTLQLGSRGADVKELQVFLNSDPDTRIAVSGVGSAGYESTYFGALTMLAVKKFQIKYAVDVLVPAGISGPNGVVGPFTRAMIYKIQQTRLFSGSASSSPVIANTRVSIGSVSPTIITRFPQTMTITGTGFTTTNNSIIISSEAEGGITGIASPDGTTLSFSFSYAGATKARAQLAHYRTSDTYEAIKAAYSTNISDTVLVQGVRVIPIVIVIKNANGESAPRTVYVNLAQML